MTWSYQTREKLSLILGGSATEEPQLRAVTAAMRRADGYAACRYLYGIQTGPKASTGQGSTRPLNMLLVKPVGDECNLSCTYCYESERRAGAMRNALSNEDFERVLDNVLPHVELPFEIYFHGGEPLLRGLQFYRKAVDAINHRARGVGISVGIQTNGVLLTKEWAQFFKAESIKVGVSIDGWSDLHDMTRVFASGVGSHGLTMRGIRTLQNECVRFGAICVLSSFAAGIPDSAARMFDFFLRNGMNAYDVHPAFSAFGTGRRFNVSPTAYAQFMIALFERWIDAANPAVTIRSFEQFFEAMTGVLGDACYRSGNCSGILGVDAGGEVSPCTRPFDSKYHFGTLLSSTLPDIFENALLNEFNVLERSGRSSHADCKWARLCGFGGCPHEREENGRQDVEGRNVFCTCKDRGEGGYPQIFEYLAQRVETLFRGDV